MNACFNSIQLFSLILVRNHDEVVGTAGMPSQPTGRPVLPRKYTCDGDDVTVAGRGSIYDHHTEAAGPSGVFNTRKYPRILSRILRGLSQCYTWI